LGFGGYCSLGSDLTRFGFLAILTGSVSEGQWELVSGIEAQELLGTLIESRDIMSNDRNVASKPSSAADEAAAVSEGKQVPGEPKHPDQTKPAGK